MKKSLLVLAIIGIISISGCVTEEELGNGGEKTEFTFVEGDSESWNIESSEIGGEVLSPSWFRFDSLSEGSSLRCRQFGSLESAQSNTGPLGEAVVDYTGGALSGYSFIFTGTAIDITITLANLPPEGYVIYRYEAVDEEPGTDGELEGNIVESPEGMPLYEGADYVEVQNILGVQGSVYVIPAHSTDVYKCYIEQMPSLGWAEVSRGMGILYFEKEDYGAAIKATEDVGPQTRLVIGYASKAEFEPIEEESVLLPTNYQTTFPVPTDVFFSGHVKVYEPGFPDFVSQTHATISGEGGEPAELSDPDFEGAYRNNVDIVHNLGIKYTTWLEPIIPVAQNFYEYRPDLLDAGIIDIDGKIGWGCINNPDWREFLLETAKRSVEWGSDGLAIDAWRSPCDQDCFCEHCMQGFKEYLKEKYSTEELEGFGVEDIDSFDYGDFIREHYLTLYKENRWEVPLYADYTDYRLESILEFWHELITETRAHGTAQGKDIYFSANTAEMWPQYIIIQDELDYFSAEYTYAYPSQGKSIPDFKLARSLGKPAFFLPNSGTSAELMARPDITTLTKIYTAEAYSARGFMMVPHEIWVWIEGAEGWGMWCYVNMEELSPYYDFIYDNEQYYESLFSTSKIAVLYSLSSAIRSGTDEFYRISDFLLNSHFQYDVLFAGDNDWIEDNLSLSQLNEYEVVILPKTECLSDQQVSLLLSYAESGGDIFAFGEIGSRDEEGNEVERALLSSLLVEDSHDYGLGRFIYNRNLPKEEVGGILSGLIQPCIQTNANENVVMIEYWNNETHSIIIHLINYNYDIETQHLTSQQNIDLEVALNSELLGKELIVSYESPDWTGTEELDYTVSDERIQFQIPNLEFYGVVSIREVGD